MNRPIGISLLAVLFWGYAVYFLWSGIAQVIYLGIIPLLSAEPSTLPAIFSISQIAIGLLLIAVTIYFVRIGMRLFRVDGSVRKPAVKSLSYILLFCGLAVLVSLTASGEVEIGFDYSLLPIAGFAIAGLSYMQLAGNKHFDQGESEQAIPQPLT